MYPLSIIRFWPLYETVLLSNKKAIVSETSSKSTGYLRIFLDSSFFPLGEAKNCSLLEVKTYPGDMQFIFISLWLYLLKSIVRFLTNWIRAALEGP